MPELLTPLIQAHNQVKHQKRSRPHCFFLRQPEQMTSAADEPSWWTSASSSATADSTDSGGDDGLALAKPARKRAKSRTGCRSASTPSYVLQKEERLDLMEEVRQLQTQLELLKIKAGISTVHDEYSLAHVQATNADMEEEIYENQHKLARVHSLITRHLQMTPIFPVALHIHLPRDRDERCRILEDMSDLKLRRATEAVLHRLSAMNPLKPYKHEERSASPDGLHHYSCFEVHQFRGLRDARQLFDALVYFRDNIEICVTDMIGQIAVREDTEQDHPTIYSARLVTTGELGGVEELNVVGFSRFYESYGPHNGAPLGVLAMDTVDEDELYPYKPFERTRKISHGTHAVTECRDPCTNESVVVLATSVFTTQLPPEFPLSPVVFSKVVENIPRWIGVMNRFLRESARTM